MEQVGGPGEGEGAWEGGSVPSSDILGDFSPLPHPSSPPPVSSKLRTSNEFYWSVQDW
jgi:hypothetical protein